MLHLFHGDPYLRRRELERLLDEKLPDPALRDLNLSRVDVRQMEWASLEEECLSMPMLGSARVVVLENLAPRWQKESQSWRERGVSCFSSAPETTELVLLEGLLPKEHPLRKAVARLADDGRAEEKVLKTPDIRDGSLVRWVVERTKSLGGDIAPDAAAVMASFVGGDLERMDRELEKLVTYAAGERVTKAHVTLLVRDARAARIFDLMDAVSGGKRAAAICLYRRLLAEGEPPLRVLSMIARQYRILLGVKALVGRGMREREIASELGMARYPVKKALGEVHRFTYERLVRSHDLILETDRAIKSGEISADVAVELLVASL